MTDDATPSPDVVFDHGLDAFTAVVDQLKPDDWDRPSPCQGWTALDVLGHLGGSVRMGLSVLRGEQPTFPDVSRPGEVVEGEPAAWWRELAAAARAALDGADLDLVMDTPMGKRTVADRLAFPAVDLFVHAWDLGQAAGIDVDIPAEAVELAHAHIDPIPDEMVRSHGVFAAEAEAPADATPTERFLAWTGRPPRG